MSKFASLLIAPIFSIALLACSEPVDDRPGQPVAHRQAAFSKMLKVFEPMGQQLRKGPYDPEKFIKAAAELDQLKNGPWAYFEPGTDYRPSRAKAAVWENPAKFEQDRQAFLQAVDTLNKAAASKQVKTVSAAYEALHETCRSCHKTFKN